MRTLWRDNKVKTWHNLVNPKLKPKMRFHDQSEFKAQERLRDEIFDNYRSHCWKILIMLPMDQRRSALTVKANEKF